jgi:hypothetical protein
MPAQKIDKMKQQMEKQLDKISPTEKDIVLLKGEWTHDEIQGLAGLANGKGINSILVIVPDDKSIETMPVDDFYYLLKEVEKKRFGGKTPESDGVCGD